MKSVAVLFAFFIFLSFTTAQEVQKIDLETAKKMILENPNIVILDVRTKEEFEESHILNAISIPFDNLKMTLARNEQPFTLKDTIIVYCACVDEISSANAAKILKGFGYVNVYVLVGGWDAWVKAGYPRVENGNVVGSFGENLKTTTRTVKVSPPENNKNMVVLSITLIFVFLFFVAGILIKKRS